MIDQIIEGNKIKFTTLTTFVAMLDGYIQQIEAGQEYAGMTAVEVNARYEWYKTKVGGIKKHYTTYLQRKTNKKGYYFERENKFFLKPDIVQNKSLDELKDYLDKIEKVLREQLHMNDEFIHSMNAVLESRSSQAIYSFIISQFDNDNKVPNFGQLYEILSYSILKVYFESFGFNLNRFSVSFSNDGGMDFISFAGIYQVTAVSDKKKAKDDLIKLPGIQRVIVLNECNQKTLDVYQSSGNVTEVITADDLKSHFLDWLRRKHTSTNNHLIKVMEVFCNEWKREFTAESIEEITTE